jgi:ABC-type lipopolysaccharide export system ATPase subunit
MPYIKQPNRITFDEPIRQLNPKNAGELNYIISKLMLKYIGKDINYQKCNDVTGALECSKMEIYRRFVAPYEEIKIKENGDII